MKAALYIRVSTDKQAEEGFSMEAQHDILMQLVERKGLQLYKVYSDPGVSGGSFKRPGIQLLLKDMKDKKFDTVIVHKLDRLSRNQGDLYGFINLINKLDVRFIIAAQGDQEIDTKGPMGKAFLLFSGIWAEVYLDNLREETLKGLTKKIEKGGRHMSRPPLGYTYDSNHELVILESEAKLVREVFQMYLSGVGRNKIAAHMNTFSRMKEGGKWDAKGIKTIVSNPTYAGYNHFKPSHWADDKRIIKNGDHEAIISEEDFRAARKIRERRNRGEMSNNSYEYAYGGILKCGRCGANFNGNSRKHKLVGEEKVYKGYRCHNQYIFKTCNQPSIAESIVNQLVFDHVIITGTTVAEKKQKKKDVIDAQKEIEVSNRRKKNWMIALGDGNLSSSDYADLIDEEEKRINDILAKVKHEETYEPEIPPEELIHMIINLKEHWGLLEEDTQKQLIQSMFRKIVIDKKENGWQLIELLTV
jgi:site-specific DNA recombinase